MAAPTGPEAQASADARLAGSMLADDASFLLARATAIALTHAGRTLGEHGLKVRSYAVLALVAGELKPTQREVADILRLDPSQVVALVDELERAGLVERVTDATDRRANLVVATGPGRHVAQEAKASLRAVDDRMYGGLGPQEREQLASLLTRVAFEE
jgi:DNA-binding MarR family transcriptional regulator